MIKLIMCGTNIDFGTLGEVTDMVHSDGSPMQVGDVFDVYNEYDSYLGQRAVVKGDGVSINKFFIMGSAGAGKPSGKLQGIKYVLNRRFYECKVGDRVGGIEYKEVMPKLSVNFGVDTIHGTVEELKELRDSITELIGEE